MSISYCTLKPAVPGLHTTCATRPYPMQVTRNGLLNSVSISTKSIPLIDFLLSRVLICQFANLFVLMQVTRNGLLNSVSIAGIMLTTQAVMVEKSKPSDVPGGMTASGMPSGMTI